MSRESPGMVMRQGDTVHLLLWLGVRYGSTEGVPHLDMGGRARGKLGTGRGVHGAEVAQHGLLDVLQLLARVGILHVADADAQPVRVHVVVVVAQRLRREAASAHTLPQLGHTEWHNGRQNDSQKLWSLNRVICRLSGSYCVTSRVMQWLPKK